MLAWNRSPLLWATSAVALLVAALGIRHLMATRRTPDLTEHTQGMNALLITVDTLRADRLGCYGYGPARTPTIDSLAAHGYQFLDAHVQVTTTVPSHASILTSLYVRSHNVYGNENVLDDRATTLAEVLADSGYFTGAVSAVAFMGVESGIGQGFRTFDAPRLGERAALAVSRLASTWLESMAGSDRKFFLWVHYFDPHLPYSPPMQFRRLLSNYEGRFEEGLTIHDMRILNAGRIPSPSPSERSQIDMLYDSEVSHVDFEIGRLLGTLRDTGLARRTIVFLLADHGESHGEHDIFYDHFGLYEPTTWIPMVLAIPGWRHGRTIGALAQSIDVMPTLLDLLGFAAPAGVEGCSLVPVLQGRGVEVNDECHAELTGRLQASVRTTGWKLILGLQTHTFDSGLGTEEGSVELYDLNNDPAETVNVAVDRPDQVAALRDSYAGWRRRSRPRWQQGERLDEQTRMSLRELGYLQ